MRADGQRSGLRRAKMNGRRGITARAPEDEFTVAGHADHGIIDMADDGPIVHEETVGHAVQTREGFGSIGADGFVGQISTGRDHGEAQFRHQ